MPREQAHNLWPIAGFSLASLLLLISSLYGQTLAYLTGLWNQVEIGLYSHGYLVFAISVYLIIRERRELASRVPKPNFRVLPVVLASSLLWLVAVLTDINVLQTVALLLLVLATVWSVLGTKVALVLLFPILLLGFAIPVWFPLSPLLQSLTTDVVYWMIRVFEIPALRQGNTIVLESGTFNIDEACGGLRYLLVALTLGSLYAYLNYRTLFSRLLLVLVSALAAIAANLMRVFIVIYLGYKTQMQHPYVHDHQMLGWYLFGGLVLLLLVLEAGIGRITEREQASAGAAPDREPSSGANPGRLAFFGIVVAVATLVSVAPLLVKLAENQHPTNKPQIDLQGPQSDSGWIAQGRCDDDWMPVYRGAMVLKHCYEKGSDTVILYVGYYAEQQQHEELINTGNGIADEDIWHTRYSSAQAIAAGDPPSLEQLLQKNSGEKRLVRYWYNVAGHKTTNRYTAKMLQLLGQVTGDRQAYVTAVATDLKDEVTAAARLDDFMLNLPEKPIRVAQNKN